MNLTKVLLDILIMAASAFSLFACWLIFTVTEIDKRANEEALRERREPANRHGVHGAGAH